jgi:hypothetical protein
MAESLSPLNPTPLALSRGTRPTQWFSILGDFRTIQSPPELGGWGAKMFISYVGFLYGTT